MKRIPIFFFLLCFVVRLNAQTYTSGNLTVTVMSTITHDSNSCSTPDIVQYLVTVDSAVLGDSVKVVDTTYGTVVGTFYNTTGASPWTFTTGAGGMSGGGTVSSIHDYSVPTGVGLAPLRVRKIATDQDTLYATRPPTPFYVTDRCEYSTVSGKAYIDNNSNCIFDAGDDPVHFPLNEFVYTPTFISPGSGYAWPTSGSYSGPDFSLAVQQSWIASATLDVPSYYYFVYSIGSCTAGPYTVTSFPYTGADFPFQCTSNLDVQCGGLCPVAVRPDMHFILHPFVSNTGCTVASGQMRVVLDHRVVYTAALSTHPADSVFGDTLVWNYSGLTNLTGLGYWNSFMSHVWLTPDTSVHAGDTLCFRAYTSVPAGDIDAANNDRTWCLPVVYSYDPNMKEVSPAGTGSEGFIADTTETLTYTLHFQNTGTAPAFNVSIIDTLDNDVDAGSIKILGATHTMKPQWLAPNIVKFNFNNINLPDSTTDEKASHGAVRFSVKLNSGLAPGTQIKNTGYIYFDANPPVVTNTALNTIAFPPVTSVGGVISGGLHIYPNPAQDILHVEAGSGGELLIADMNGRVLVTQQMTASRATVNIKQLPAGVYLVRISGAAEAATARLIKY